MPPQAMILGGRTYNNPVFKTFMNSHYYPLESMKRSVAILRASNQIDIETLEFGQYQPILAPLETWPNGGGASWMREMGRARLELSAQRNEQPLSLDEQTVVPLTKCALLDACVRKCFNSLPEPIPIQIDNMQKKADAENNDVHDIKLEWTYGNGEGQVPTLLRLTMICPFIPEKSSKA